MTLWALVHWALFGVGCLTVLLLGFALVLDAWMRSSIVRASGWSPSCYTADASKGGP